MKKVLIALIVLVLTLTSNIQVKSEGEFYPVEVLKAMLKAIGTESSILIADMDKNELPDVNIMILSSAPNISTLQEIIVISMGVGLLMNDGQLSCDKTFVLVNPQTLLYNQCSVLQKCVNLPTNKETGECFVATWGVVKDE